MYAYRDECANFLENLPIYKEICTNDTSINCDIRKTILIDLEFPEKVKEEMNRQDPVCKLIREAEKKTSTLSVITGLWLNLKNEMPLLPAPLKKKIDARLDMALTPLALTAFYFDPRSDKTLLSKYHRSEINTFCVKYLKGKSLDHYIDYGDKKGEFRELFDRKLKARTFWKILEPTYPSLSEFALKVTVIPASTSQLERIFHNWSTIHTKLRNRLTSEKSKKLVHIYYSYISSIPQPNPEEDDDQNQQGPNEIEQLIDGVASTIEIEDDDESVDGFDLDDIDISEDSDFEELLGIVNQPKQ